MLTEVKESIAEAVFSKQLDEAYKLGMRAGAEYAMTKISFEVKLKNHLKLTKTEDRGYDRSIEVIERVKADIRSRLKFNPKVNYLTGETND